MEVGKLKQMQAVDKVQPRNGSRLVDGRQVHHLVLLDQRVAESTELVDLARIQRDGGFLRKNLFHTITSE